MTDRSDAATRATAMKLGMRRMAASVSVLTAQSSQGEDLAMTVSSVTSVTDAPASLLVCVQNQTRMHEALSLGSRFAVNVLTEHHSSLSTLCATAEQGEARFALGPWRRQPGEPAELLDAEAVFFCQVDKLVAYGTHSVIIGVIERVELAGADPTPLVYLNGSYRRATALGGLGD